jgi:hypothetical protein
MGSDADSVQMEIALVSRPFNDPFINEELWRQVDEQDLPLEQRPRLTANGLRVGTLGGNVPAELQRLLTSEKECVKARRLTLRKGHEHFWSLARKTGQHSVRVIEDKETILQDVEDPEIGLVLCATVNDDGEPILHCEPRLRHGPSLRRLKPAGDLSDWTLLSGRSEEKYPHLAWEWSFARSEYGVIGGIVDQEKSLGWLGFVDLSDSPRQRLLVIRTAGAQPPSPPAPLADASTTTNPKREPANAGPPPLALQSLRSTTPPSPSAGRGQSP